MGLSSNPQSKANQLANLRPVSADPALASAMGKKYGFGSGRAAQCQKIKKNGEQCRNPAAWGAPVCPKHKARLYRVAREKSPSPFRDASAALKALVQHRDEIPLELTRHPEWIRAATLSFSNRYPRYLALFKAWQSMQNGNPEPWRKLTKP